MTEPSADRVRVDVLGTVEVTCAGRTCAVNGRRPHALLAALALEAPHPVPVTELIDAVWDDDPPEQARTTLQTYVSRLRRQLGAATIGHRSGGYRLAPDVRTDVGEVRELVDRLESVAPDDREAVVGLTGRALGLWRGAALGELVEHRWFRGHVAALGELRAALTERSAGALILAGRPEAALPLLENLIGAQPFREPSRILLARALHAAGRTTDALRATAAYRRELREETGLHAGPELTALEQELLRDDVAGDDASADLSESPLDEGLGRRSTAALARPTSLIARERELDELTGLARRHRLVTVTGLGGIGKTRLVAELVHLHQDGEHVVVDLVPVQPGSVAAAVGAALGLRADLPAAADLPRLVGDSHLTIVLDNAEHVVDDVREVVRFLMDRTPHVRVLVTSRARLDLPHEHVFALDPLRTGGHGEVGAIELFLDRVRRAHPRFDLDPHDPAVGELCRRLDGVPLALELAAGRAAVLGVDTLVERLDSELVDGEEGRSHERHATVHGLIGWSYDLLGDDARTLLTALAVLEGEFDLDAAEAVGAPVVETPVALVLGRLVASSLVATTHDVGRYRLLHIVRGFARARLDEAPFATTVRRAHATWTARRAAEIDRDSIGPHEPRIRPRITALRHELRAAIHDSVERGDIAMAGAIAHAVAGPALYRPDPQLLHEIARLDVLALAGSSQEARIRAAIARASFLIGELGVVDAHARRGSAVAGGDSIARSRCAHALGVLALYQGRFGDARASFCDILDDPAAALADRLDALGGLALAACYGGDLDSAARAVTELRATATTVGSETYLAFADYAEGETMIARRDPAAALTHLGAAADRGWAVGADFVWGIASTVLVSVLVRDRPPEEARRHLPTLLQRWRRTATWPQLWTTLRLVAEHLAVADRPDVALLILIAADSDPAAPTLTGDDLVRIGRVRADVERALGPAAVSGIEMGARSLDRAAVLDRAVAALTS